MMRGSRIEQKLREFHESGQGALLPYLTSGFPEPSVTEKLIRVADSMGVPVVEIGIPCSDSIADGPVIQASFNHALAGGHRVENAMETVARVRRDVGCGLVAMVSYSIVHRVGVEAFMMRAAESGFDGVILPDLPVEESAGAFALAERAGLCHIGLVAPTTSADRRRLIARHSSGFIYQIAVAGTTGERAELPAGLADDVDDLRRIGGLPVCVGFGISRAAHVREVCRVADGAIVGSAIIGRIFGALEEDRGTERIVESVSNGLSELWEGTRIGPE